MIVFFLTCRVASFTTVPYAGLQRCSTHSESSKRYGPISRIHQVYQSYVSQREQDDEGDNIIMTTRRQVFRSLAQLPTNILVRTAFLASIDPAIAVAAVPSQSTVENGSKRSRSSTHDNIGGNNYKEICLTQCARNTCKDNERSIDKNIVECECDTSGVKCQDDTGSGPIESSVREPLLVPSKPIPGLYSRWQDDDPTIEPLESYVREPLMVPSKPIPGLYPRWQDE